MDACVFTQFKPVYIINIEQVEEAVALYKRIFRAVEIGPQQNLRHGEKRVDLLLHGTRSTMVVTNAAYEFHDGQSGTNSAIVYTTDVRRAVDRAVRYGATRDPNIAGKVVDLFGFTWLFSSTPEKICMHCHMPLHFPALCSEVNSWMITRHGHEPKEEWVSWDQTLERMQRAFENQHSASFYAHPDLFHLINHMCRLVSMLRWLQVLAQVKPEYNQLIPVSLAAHDSFKAVWFQLPHLNADPSNWPDDLSLERMYVVDAAEAVINQVMLVRRSEQYQAGEPLSDEQNAMNNELSKHCEFWKFGRGNA